MNKTTKSTYFESLFQSSFSFYAGYIHGNNDSIQLNIDKKTMAMKNVTNVM